MSTITGQASTGSDNKLLTWEITAVFFILLFGSGLHFVFEFSNFWYLVAPFAGSPSLAELSPAELKVANMVKYGKTSKEIGVSLNISEETVRFHRRRIRKKLGKHNITSTKRIIKVSTERVFL